MEDSQDVWSKPSRGLVVEETPITGKDIENTVKWLSSSLAVWGFSPGEYSEQDKDEVKKKIQELRDQAVSGDKVAQQILSESQAQLKVVMPSVDKVTFLPSLSWAKPNKTGKKIA